MNYAGRMNSFIFKGGNVLDAIAEYKKMHGLTHLEFNYPEHVEGYDIQEITDFLDITPSETWNKAY